jgi:hypothetical protein
MDCFPKISDKIKLKKSYNKRYEPAFYCIHIVFVLLVLKQQPSFLHSYTYENKTEHKN